MVVAKNTEKHIRDQGISDSDSKPYRDSGSLTPMRVWIAMRSVLDFNFHQSLELYIKLILRLEDTSYKFEHSLVKLFDLMSEKSQDEFQKLLEENPMKEGDEMVAFQAAKSRPKLPEPTSPDFGTVRGMFEYFDGELELYKRRYGWETMSRGHWLQFVKDIQPWLKFLDGVDCYSVRLANSRGLFEGVRCSLLSMEG